ncbi:MAG: trehalose-phosphatase [Candidatus Eisenbacteria bacterium]|nr:trehalose-phosphatase [Candidatus Eisenbacteria bacterium]
MTDDPAAALKAIESARGERSLALFFDYDGTLTPIVAHPDQALLQPEMRRLLDKLSRLCPAAIVSGRDRADVRSKVELDRLYYAGSHGLDISGPDGMHVEQPGARAALADLDVAESRLRTSLGRIEGAWVERKRFALAVHYRAVEDAEIPRVEAAVDETLEQARHLRKQGGKKIFELRPDIDWDKGHAVEYLLETLNLNTESTMPIYIGDDVTDEDGFRAVSDTGLGIRVGDVAETAAHLNLGSVDHVRELLSELVSRLQSHWEDR